MNRTNFLLTKYAIILFNLATPDKSFFFCAYVRPFSKFYMCFEFLSGSCFPCFSILKKMASNKSENLGETEDGTILAIEVLYLYSFKPIKIKLQQH